MKPLILKFSEYPVHRNLDYSQIEYSNSRNLSVIKGTQIPAIAFANMDTETFTKNYGEPTDSDLDIKQNIKQLTDTNTHTYYKPEGSDNDINYSLLRKNMDTQTFTESNEPIDSDK